MKNLCLYLRVSTNGQTIDPQRLELETYAKSKGWTIAKEYSDVISGAKSSRKGFDKLMEDAKAGLIDAVMVVKIDRLARSVIHFSQIVENFAALNVALIIPGQNIDTRASNPAGRLTMNILASVASFERDLIRERTLSGLANARAKGRFGGRPTGSGVKELPMEQIRALAAEGKSLREASRLLNVPFSTVQRRFRILSMHAMA